MKYKKLLTSTRFRTKSQSKFTLDAAGKAVLIGRRDATLANTVFLGKVLEQSSTSNLLDYGIMSDIGFPHVIGIFGSRGSGKSYDLGVIIEGIFNADRGKVRDAAVIFDIQDQFWTLGYAPREEFEVDREQLKELEAWGIAPIGLDNVKVWVPRSSDTQVSGAIPFSLAASQLSDDDWLSILELERYSAMGQALLTLIGQNAGATPGRLARLCDTRGLLNNFQQSTIDGLRWRLESLDASQVVDSDGLAVDDLLKEGQLTVVLMRNLPEAIRGLIVGVISRLVADRMGRVQQARKVALRMNGTLPAESENLTNRLWLVLDEAHVLVPSDGSTAATGPMVDYVKRGRDAGLSLIFATQQPSAVNSKLISQVDMTLTHMLGFDADLNAAIARMPTRSTVEYEIDHTAISSMSDVIRSLGPGECVVADQASSRIFVAKIRPRATAHGGATPK